MKTSLRELRHLCKNGVARDFSKFSETVQNQIILKDYQKIAYATGKYGLYGVLIHTGLGLIAVFGQDVFKL